MNDTPVCEACERDASATPLHEEDDGKWYCDEHRGMGGDLVVIDTDECEQCERWFYGNGQQCTVHGEEAQQAARRERDGADGHCELWQWGTYAPTPRLERLRDGSEAMTANDAAILFAMFVEGSADSGVPPTMLDFGQWVSGTGAFDGCEPADVMW